MGFVAGIGCYTKLSVAYPIVALFIATLAVDRRKVFEYINPRNTVFSISSFILGGLPMIAFSAHRGLTRVVER